jgi:predicted secreted hydrolase
MNASWLRILALWLCIFAGNLASAQGFAGLGSDAGGFALPDRDSPPDFPADHGPHPDFRIEWWYLTANLQDAAGREFGVQWTLFRSALAPGEAPGWRSPQVWMGHAAVTAPDTHRFAERFARGGIGQAGVIAAPFDAWIDDWRMTGVPGNGVQDLTLTARGPDFAFDLSLQATSPLVLHGADGYSVKSAGGQASYYYSQPRYRVSGTLTLPDGPVAVTGNGWLDREWSSQPLAADQTGWDWFSLSFDSGAQMMGFRLRDGAGGYTSGTWIDPDGGATALPPGALAFEPLETAQVDARVVPVVWRVTLPDHALDVTVSAINPQAWMGTVFPYWEGPVRVTGSHPGRGYLEMTGYE